jgi:hypothetical protein
MGILIPVSYQNAVRLSPASRNPLDNSELSYESQPFGSGARQLQVLGLSPIYCSYS